MGFFDRLLGNESSDDLYDPLGDPSLTKATRLTSEGNHHGDRGNFDRAISCFKQAISAKRDHVPAYLGLSTAYRCTGEFQRALDTLSSAPQAEILPGIDAAFEIAFAKAGVLIAKHQLSGFRGDTSDLLAALEEAWELGGEPFEVTESLRQTARLQGEDLEEERRQKLELVEEMLAGVREGGQGP